MLGIFRLTRGCRHSWEIIRAKSHNLEPMTRKCRLCGEVQYAHTVWKTKAQLLAGPATP